MRTGLTFLGCALLWGLGSCAGNHSAPDPAGPAAANGGGLQGLPAPREAAAAASVLQVAAGSSSHFVQTSLHPTHEGVGVTAEAPDWSFKFAERSPEQLAHIFFIIMHQQDAATTMGQLSLDLSWQGETPTGMEGFYVGVADRRSNTWRWLGPIRSAGDILDFAPFALNGDAEANNRLQIALVNYAPVAVKVKTISFTTIDPQEVSGDETLFYLTDSNGSFAINRVLSGSLDEPQQLLPFIEGENISGLTVFDTVEEDLLIFDRQAVGGVWEVWQCNLDGSNPQPRHTGQGDVRFAGYDAARAREFTRVDGGSFGHIRRHDMAGGTVDLERDLPGAIVGTPRWYNMGGGEIALYGTGLDAEEQPMAMQYTYYQMWDMENYRDMLFLSGSMQAKDPFYFIWGYNQDPSSNSMTLFSGKAAGEETFKIRLNIFCNPPNANNEIIVGDDTANLEFPSLSPDHKLLSFLKSAPGATTGQLLVQSAFLRELDPTAVVADDVSGPAVWFDPTPLAASIP